MDTSGTQFGTSSQILELTYCFCLQWFIWRLFFVSKATEVGYEHSGILVHTLNPMCTFLWITLTWYSRSRSVADSRLTSACIRMWNVNEVNSSQFVFKFSRLATYGITSPVKGKVQLLHLISPCQFLNSTSSPELAPRCGLQEPWSFHT
jgi:hypothetical protein